MESAISVFLNGISGVFIGIGVLYLAIRLNAFVCSSGTDSKKP